MWDLKIKSALGLTLRSQAGLRLGLRGFRVGVEVAIESDSGVRL